MRVKHYKKDPKYKIYACQQKLSQLTLVYIGHKPF